MTNWMTGSEISARYIASEQKLLDYARRGNMPMFRQDDGSYLFDEAHAATLFRRRGPSPMVDAPADGKPSMGVLGVSRLGERAAPQRMEAVAAASEEPMRHTRCELRFVALAELPPSSFGAFARKAG